MLHSSYRCLISLRLLAGLMCIGAATIARAQTADTEASLPSAPEPQQQTVADLARFTFVQEEEAEGKQSATSSPGSGHADPEIVTMFPHPEDGRYWISGQANIIFQGRLPFHSLYQGTNSFRNSAEYKTSLVGTLYTALRRSRSIRYNT